MKNDEPYTSGYLKGLNKNVLVLGWISFVADIASEMLYPIMPIFVASVIGVPVVALGAIEGCAELTASLLKLFSGALTDRSQKRRTWIFWGYILSAVARPLIGFATSWHLVGTGRVLDRIGKGIRTSPRDALLGDSVEAKYSGKAFGFHRGMDTLGAFLGPLLSLLLLSLLQNNMRWLFFIAFIPGLLAAISVFKIHEVRHHANSEMTPTWQLEKLPAKFWQVLFALTIFSLCNSSDIFVLLKLQKITGSTANVIFYYCGFNLVYALTSPYLGDLSDRVGKLKVMLFGLFLFAIIYFLFAISQEPSTMLAGLLLYGLYMAATEGISKALVVDLVPKHLKGTAIGVLGLSLGLSSLIASTVGGILWDRMGMAWTFYLGVVGAALGFVLILLVGRTPPGLSARA